jgi:hypothetical protein
LSRSKGKKEKGKRKKAKEEGDAPLLRFPFTFFLSLWLIILTAFLSG